MQYCACSYFFDTISPMKTIATINALRFLYGPKKVEILEYIIEKSDENLIFRGTHKSIMEALHVSKPTVVLVFKELKNNHLITKEKNGLYRVNKKIFQNKDDTK